MLILIGSQAMKRYFQEFREPKDWDWFCTNEDEPKSKSPNSRNDIFRDQRLAAWDWGHPDDGDMRFATINELYTIKISHSFWNLHGTWNKHAADILFLQRKGALFLPELYDILLPIWKEKHRPKRTSLNQTKEEFFGDAVTRKYDHDSVHRSVAYEPGKPLYETFLKENSDVMVDNAKFWALPHETRLKAFREEVMATALERWVIPQNYKVSPRLAYANAVRLTATSLFKNKWALEFMLNYQYIHQPPFPYVDWHLKNSQWLEKL